MLTGRKSNFEVVYTDTNTDTTFRFTDVCQSKSFSRFLGKNSVQPFPAVSNSVPDVAKTEDQKQA